MFIRIVVSPLAQRLHPHHAVAAALRAAVFTVLTMLVGAHCVAQAATTAKKPATKQAANPQAATQTLLAMRAAYYRNQSSALQAMLPTIAGHPLEPLGAYWTLKARLEDASDAEVDAFFKRWAGSYYEDRLRNDWMLLLGQRQAWGKLLAAHGAFRMNDDRDVVCYVWQAQLALGQASASSVAPNITPQGLVAMWRQQSGRDEACLGAVAQLLRLGLVSPDVVWARARDAAMWADKAAFVDAVALVEPEARSQAAQLYDNPLSFLNARRANPKGINGNWLGVALVRLTMRDIDEAIAQLPDWLPYLNVYQQTWVNATLATREAMRLDPNANLRFANTRNDQLSDTQLEWKVRAALRAGDWTRVLETTQDMPLIVAQQPVWLYWRARALLSQGTRQPNNPAAVPATQLLQSIATPHTFYGQLAMQTLGQTVTTSRTAIRPRAADEREVRRNDSLLRALAAIDAGLRGEGVREWNYAVALHEPGGMPDAQLQAAAQWACERAIWDRCINTAARIKGNAGSDLLYPMPFKDAVVSKAKQLQLDPAVVFGLVRQESRFVTDARSGVGATGLMQIMPATAKWTARKIGLKGFDARQLNDHDTNLRLGTSYLRLLLDDFQASLPMATAAYNAGPNRPKRWRGTDADSPTLEAAIWIENIPFNETRAYVQHVVANSVNYAARITGQPQTIAAHLAPIGPAPTAPAAGETDAGDTDSADTYETGESSASSASSDTGKTTANQAE
jgi:soluble lytic murein transglycosylase